MTRKIALALALAGTLGLARGARPDVWDTSVDNDNGNNTDNQITHGLTQVHDLGALPGPVPDEDWYYLIQEPFSSYEVLCDGFTGDVSAAFPNTLQRVDAGGGALQDSADYGSSQSFARSLRFANNTSFAITDQWVRVGNADCGTTCGPQDQYRIRAWETTIAVPRYNNAAGQVTVLIIQNPGELAVSGNARLWTTAGGLTPVTTVPFSLPAREAAVINLATVNGGAANGTGGTITITNNARYGQLAVKAVALEPATGFSFDSPGLYKPD